MVAEIFRLTPGLAAVLTDEVLRCKIGLPKGVVLDVAVEQEKDDPLVIGGEHRLLRHDRAGLSARFKHLLRMLKHNWLAPGFPVILTTLILHPATARMTVILRIAVGIKAEAEQLARRILDHRLSHVAGATILRMVDEENAVVWWIFRGKHIAEAVVLPQHCCTFGKAGNSATGVSSAAVMSG